MILIGAVVANPSTIIMFMSICLVICGCGYISYKS